MYCKHCGKKIDANSVFCKYCGKDITFKPEIKVKIETEKKRKEELKPVSVPAIVEMKQNENPLLKIFKSAWSAIINDKKNEAENTPVKGDVPNVFGQKIRKYLGPVGSFEFGLLAFVLVLIGQVQMFIDKNVSGGLAFFIAGVLVFWFADIISNREYKQFEVKKKTEIILFSIVVLIAIFFRTYGIESIPPGFYYDETLFSQHALKLLETGNMPIYSTQLKFATPFIYIIAAMFKLFGIGVLQERMFSVILGILSIPAFYFLVRKMFGVPAALFGALILAVMRWHVNFSRVGFYAAGGVFLAILALYFIWKAYKDRTWVAFIFMGITVGLVPYGYTPGRMLFPGLLLFMAFLVVRDYKFYTINWKKIIISFLLFLATLSPFLLYFKDNPKEFMSRNNQVSILNKEVVQRWFQGRFTVKQAVIDSVKKHMLMFNRAGDGNARHNNPGYPNIGFITGVFGVLGFGYMILRLFNPLAFFWLALFFSFMVPGFVTIEAPQSHRVIFVIPVIAVFCTLYIHRMIGYARENEKIIRKMIVLTGIVLASILVINVNYDDYFNKHAKNPRFFMDFTPETRMSAEYLLSKGTDWQAFIYPIQMNIPFLFIMKAQKEKNYQMFKHGDSIPAPEHINKNLLYIVPKDYNPYIEVLKGMYPNGKYIPIYVPNTNKQLFMSYYEVPLSDVQAYRTAGKKHGLEGKYYRGTNWQGRYTKVRIDPILFFRWHIAPVTGNFSVQWTGTIKTNASGDYAFMTQSNDFSQIFIDGVKIYDQSIKGSSGKVNLTKGRHKIKILYSSSTAYANLKFIWRTPANSTYVNVPYSAMRPY